MILSFQTSHLKVLLTQLFPDLNTTYQFKGIATSVPLPTGSWQCFEYHVSPDGTIETWLNSKVIPGLTIQAGATNAHAAIWQSKSYKPQVTGVYFGWEAYGGDANTFWYDDINIASTRPGCLGSSTA
jgi:Cip1-like, core domain